ncbi:hypothetical protein Efla_006396 [Eimeria flavescens]
MQFSDSLFPPFLQQEEAKLGTAGSLRPLDVDSLGWKPAVGWRPLQRSIISKTTLAVVVLFIATIMLVYTCLRLRSKAAKTGLQSRRLAEGDSEEGDEEGEEQDGILEECKAVTSGTSDSSTTASDSSEDDGEPPVKKPRMQGYQSASPSSRGEEAAVGPPEGSLQYPQESVASPTPGEPKTPYEETSLLLKGLAEAGGWASSTGPSPPSTSGGAGAPAGEPAGSGDPSEVAKSSSTDPEPPPLPEPPRSPVPTIEDIFQMLLDAVSHAGPPTEEGPGPSTSAAVEETRPGEPDQKAPFLPSGSDTTEEGASPLGGSSSGSSAGSGESSSSSFSPSASGEDEQSRGSPLSDVSTESGSSSMSHDAPLTPDSPASSEGSAGGPPSSDTEESTDQSWSPASSETSTSPTDQSPSSSAPSSPASQASD